MTVDEAANTKREFERTLLKLITEFESVTGFEVDSIGWQRDKRINQRGPGSLVDIIVRVGLP